MLLQATDFLAEADDLHALLVALTDADWDRPTLFKRWTINDIVQHLHDGDLMAAASAEGPPQFAQFRAERQALLASGLTRVQAARQRLRSGRARRALSRARNAYRMWRAMSGFQSRLLRLFRTGQRPKYGLIHAAASQPRRYRRRRDTPLTRDQRLCQAMAGDRRCHRDGQKVGRFKSII